MNKNRKGFVAISILLIASLLLSACTVTVFPDDRKEAGIVIYSDENDANTTEAVKADTSDELEWWKEINAYEIYVKSFKDTDGDGIGDLNGITEELDHLESLGVGAIWLTPVYQSPQKDNGYDVADYYEIDEMYGTMEDMDKLIAEAKKRDIRIVMDLVFNHTSDQCEWFLESMEGNNNDKSDWYIWRDAKEDGSEPTNWRSIFGGSAWKWCEERQQYYLHTFLEEQPDLNWENPEVRQALFDVANYWVDKGVGGFRMDAIPYIKKPEVFEDGTPDAADGMVKVHNMTANTEGILDYLREFKTEVQEGTDIFTVGEANGVAAKDLPQWVGSEGVFDMIFEFNHIGVNSPDDTDWGKVEEWMLTDLKKCLSDSQEATSEDGWYPIFFENHDQPRSIDHFFAGTDEPEMSAKAMGTVLLTLRGTPFIYQGEELGLENVDWDSIDEYNDISTINHYDYMIQHGYSEQESIEAMKKFSRDNARTPMQWTAEENAGFTTGDPWLPVYDDYAVRNVEKESEDKSSVLSWYLELAKIRSEKRVFIDGNYEEMIPENEQIYSFKRDNGENEAYIFVNFSKEDAAFDPSLKEDGELLVSSYGDEPEEGVLRPYESVIFYR